MSAQPSTPEALAKRWRLVSNGTTEGTRVYLDGTDVSAAITGVELNVYATGEVRLRLVVDVPYADAEVDAEFDPVGWVIHHVGSPDDRLVP